MRKEKGFTLIEMIIAIGLLALLAALVIIAINPAQQFADARDAQRRSDVRAILNAFDQNIISNKGQWKCSDKVTSNLITMPSDNTLISSDDLDICHCLVPDFLAALPSDPTLSSLFFIDCTAVGSVYNTGYVIKQDSNSHRVTVSSTGEMTSDISVTR